MAHGDACKIEVMQIVKNIMDKKRITLHAACKEAEKESDGIPAATIRRWHREFKEATEKLLKNEQPPTTDKKTCEGVASDPTMLTVKHGKAKTNHGISQYIKIYFSPCQEEIYDLVVNYLKDHGKEPGKEHKGSFHMYLKEFIDILNADFTLKIQQGIIPAERVGEEPETAQEGEHGSA
jgi:hypothetical protein